MILFRPISSSLGGGSSSNVKYYVPYTSSGIEFERGDVIMILDFITFLLLCSRDGGGGSSGILVVVVVVVGGGGRGGGGGNGGRL